MDLVVRTCIVGRYGLPVFQFSQQLNDLLNRGAKQNGPKEPKGTELANRFNDLFVQVGGTHSSSKADIFISAVQQSLFFEPTCVTEVCEIFDGLKTSHSRDVDDLEIRPIKYIVDVIAHVLTHIFNTELLTGVFPTSMQVAKVRVIYKHGEKDNIGNYRPVSILPIFSKGLEKRYSPPHS